MIRSVPIGPRRTTTLYRSIRQGATKATTNATNYGKVQQAVEMIRSVPIGPWRTTTLYRSIRQGATKATTGGGDDTTGGGDGTKVANWTPAQPFLEMLGSVETIRDLMIEKQSTRANATLNTESECDVINNHEDVALLDE
eukprot:scaffold20510_cov54-Attheya_sp.AAC.1